MLVRLKRPVSLKTSGKHLDGDIQASPWSGWHSKAVPQLYTHHFSKGSLVTSTRTRFKVHKSCRPWGCWTPVGLCASRSEFPSVKWGEEHFSLIPPPSGCPSEGRNFAHCHPSFRRFAGLIPNFSVLFCVSDICDHQNLFHGLCSGTELSTCWEGDRVPRAGALFTSKRS